MERRPVRDSHVPRFCVPARAAGLATFICGKIRCCALAGRNLSRILIVAESVGPLFFNSNEITLAAQYDCQTEGHGNGGVRSAAEISASISMP